MSHGLNPIGQMFRTGQNLDTQRARRAVIDPPASLVRDQAKSITGRVFPVDGAFTAVRPL